LANVTKSVISYPLSVIRYPNKFDQVYHHKKIKH